MKPKVEPKECSVVPSGESATNDACEIHVTTSATTAPTITPANRKGQIFGAVRICTATVRGPGPGTVSGLCADSGV
jgi:hypothetical protein